MMKMVDIIEENIWFRHKVAKEKRKSQFLNGYIKALAETGDFIFSLKTQNIKKVAKKYKLSPLGELLLSFDDIKSKRFHSIPLSKFYEWLLENELPEERINRLINVYLLKETAKIVKPNPQKEGK